MASEEGQRLDAARAEFRAAWRAQVERQQQRARLARKVARLCDFLFYLLPALGVGAGLLAWLTNPRSAGLEAFITRLLLGAAVVVPFTSAALEISYRCKRFIAHVELLE
jgi:hypothetical protein